MELNEKQLQILEVAEKLFAEQGFDATSVRQIAKEAEVNVAMISYYFGSKEKLLETLLDYKTSDFRAEIESITNDEQFEYMEKIDAIIELIIKRVHKHRRTHKIINFEYSNGCRSIDFQKYIDHKRDNYLILENFIKIGQEKGLISQNINLPLVMPTVLGTYFHFYYSKKIFQSLHNLSDIEMDNYVSTTLTTHIQRTIKAILTYEN